MVKVHVDQDDEAKHQSATIRGGLTSGGIGLTVALVASLAANSSRYPAFKSYRALTLPLKAFAVTAATTASFIIGADSASRQFELNKYRIGSGTALEEQAYRDLHAEELLITEESGAKRAIDLRTLSTRDAIVEWAKAHRYAVVFGAWAATMVGSFGYISMTPLSFSQKLVQSRMVAQGATVALLIASAGLNQIPTAAGGENDEEMRQILREDSTYKWKKNSPHELAKHGGEHGESAASSTVA